MTDVTYEFKKVDAVEDVPFPTEPNLVLVDNWHINYMCPCGCRREVRLPRRDAYPNAKNAWSVDVEAKSITPSVREMMNCKAHYFITGGKAKFCSDSGR